MRLQSSIQWQQLMIAKTLFVLWDFIKVTDCFNAECTTANVNLLHQVDACQACPFRR